MAKRPSQGDLEKTVEKARRSRDELAGYFSDGTLDADAFGDRFATLLTNRHAQAATLGRKRAGDFGMDETDDRIFAEAIVEGERGHIDKLVRQLEEGAYRNDDGRLNVKALQKRMDLYLQKLPSTANRAMTLASDPDLMIDWILGDPEVSHCHDCPDLAAHGPYRAEDLPTTPGACDTECLFKCLCELERADGLACFEPV